eukprot:9424120-Lingulodinium_polyedra.AAC.1
MGGSRQLELQIHSPGPDNSARGAHVRPSQTAQVGGRQPTCPAVKESDVPGRANARHAAIHPVSR